MSHKEEYFKIENIRKIVDGLEGSRGRGKFCLNERAILIIMDPQRVFCDNSSPAFIPSWPKCRENILKIMPKLKEFGVGVALTKHIMEDRIRYIPFENFFDRKLTNMDPLSEIEDTFLSLDIAIFEKDNFSIFSSRGIDHILTSMDYIIFCGVKAENCITSSVLDCGNFGITPIVVADGICGDNFRNHEAVLRIISCGHGYVVTSDELIGIVGESN